MTTAIYAFFLFTVCNYKWNCKQLDFTDRINILDYLQSYVHEHYRSNRMSLYCVPPKGLSSSWDSNFTVISIKQGLLDSALFLCWYSSGLIKRLLNFQQYFSNYTTVVLLFQKIFRNMVVQSNGSNLNNCGVHPIIKIIKILTWQKRSVFGKCALNNKRFIKVVANVKHMLQPLWEIGGQ